MIAYKNKTLLNNVLVTRYFKQITGKKFFEEFKKYERLLVKDGGKGKKAKLDVSIEDFDDISELFESIYLAGRCAFEKRMLSVEEQDNELGEISLIDEEFYSTMIDFMEDIVKTAEKSSSNLQSKKK